MSFGVNPVATARGTDKGRNLYLLQRVLQLVTQSLPLSVLTRCGSPRRVNSDSHASPFSFVT